MKKILILSLISVALVGCGNSKEAVYNKCLNQANLAFGNDIDGKAKHFYLCMIEADYGFSCNKQNNNDLFASGCYKDRGY